MRSLALLPLILLAAPPEELGPPKKERDQAGCIAGVYSVQGEERGKRYVGAATLTHVGGPVYEVRWTTGTVGVGVRGGNSLAVHWKFKDGAGLTTYVVNGKSLSGTWVILGSDGLDPHGRTETLTWLAKLPGET